MSPEILKEIITTPMPYGKYKGTMIADLPSYYLEWFSTQGFPKGKLGMLTESNLPLGKVAFLLKMLPLPVMCT